MPMQHVSSMILIRTAYVGQLVVTPSCGLIEDSNFGEFGGWINLSEAPTIAAQHGSTKLACFTFEFFSYSLSKTHAILLSLGTPTAKHYALPSDSVILGCSCLFFLTCNTRILEITPLGYCMIL